MMDSLQISWNLNTLELPPTKSSALSSGLTISWAIFDPTVAKYSLNPFAISNVFFVMPSSPFLNEDGKFGFTFLFPNFVASFNPNKSELPETLELRGVVEADTELYPAIMPAVIDVFKFWAIVS